LEINWLRWPKLLNQKKH